ncbi:phage minor capsid protein [Limosilactobacillus vaginalis]|uniref:phage minor capsid protein n=1 Tax=Limosilactobacillus vaginalis TaxID=1633 RepID=UPI003AAD6307
MTARDDFQKAANKITNAYEELQSQIFNNIIDTLKDGDYKHVSKDDVVTWQAKQLAEMGKLNQQTMKLMAHADGLSEDAIKDLIKFHGLKVIDEVDGELQDATGRSEPVSSDTQNALTAVVSQTWTDMNNNINESLISRNYGATATTRVYRQILTESTLATVSGLMTHQKAVESAVYRAVDRGLPTKLVDKAGHNWSIEGYSRMVVNTTVNRTYNDLRLSRMKDFDMHLALMSSHPNSRPACAWIQGHVVNIVPPESPDFNDKYDSIYNHGYGEPSGCEGINCRHTLTPFVPGVNVNHEPQYDPEKAIANGKLVQQQRARERAIRDAKHRLIAAQELGDEEQINHCKTLIRSRQANIRDFIKKTNKDQNPPILSRDYSREKVVAK